MAGIGYMNIVLSQGDAIKEVQNIRKQSLDVQQQFVAQKAVDKRQENKSSVQKFETQNRIEIKNGQSGQHKDGRSRQQKNPLDTEKEKHAHTEEETRIDIRV